MTDCKHEKISALVDGEDIAGRAEVVDHLLKDEALRANWARYHLIADCLRGRLSGAISDVSETVSHRLKDEPVIFSPEHKKPVNLKPLAGLAIAASVAMLAVLVVQMGDRAAAPAPPAAVASGPPAGGASQSFAFEKAPLLPARAVADQRMKNYLVNHNEFRTNGGINGIPPYVRMVTFESPE